VYVPEHFRESDPVVLHAFMREHSFATLVSTAPEGPFATHLPLLLDADRGARGTLLGHLARANPHAALLATGAPVLTIFHGPHAYVTPQWYATPMAVPTWNYAVVHAYGRPRVVDDIALRAILDRTVATYEAAFAYQWRPPRGDFVETLMRNVVGFAIEIDRLEGKLKLSQNRSKDDRAGVVRGLREHGEERGVAVAELMERTR